jgi:hypothetical protein
MLRRVAHVRTDISEKRSTSFIRVTRIGELGTTLVVSSNRRGVSPLLVTANVVPSPPILVTRMNAALSPSETSVRTRATWRNIQEDTILHFLRISFQCILRVSFAAEMRLSAFPHYRPCPLTPQFWV